MPRKSTISHKNSSKRKQHIIRAALDCFLESGYANTTMDDIRRRSGASNGSIYHHFKSKDLLAGAVYFQGLIEYQTGLLEELARSSGARDGVRSVVGYHLRWVEEHTDWARYLLEMRHAEFMNAMEAPIAEQNRQFVKRLIEWLRPKVEAGALRRLSPDLFISLVIGPCQEYTRIWLAGQTRTELSVAVEELARTAWLAVGGREQADVIR